MPARPRIAALATLLFASCSWATASTPMPVDPTPVPIPGPTTLPTRSVPPVFSSPEPRGLATEACTQSGTDGPDELVGTDGPDVLCGLGGDDRLEGMEGNDRLIGGAGDDTLLGGGGDDVLRGDEGRDVLDGGDGVDLLFGAGGDDVAAGGPGDDYQDGGAGENTLDGGEGSDACRNPASGLSCSSTSPRDGPDTKGRLDLRLVGWGPEAPAWRLVTMKSWSTRALWDRGFLLVFLDTRGDPAPDQYAMVRAERRRVRADLYRVRGARDRLMGRVPARSPGPRKVLVRVPRSRLLVGEGRTYYRWSALTMYTGKGCHRVCFDHAPDEMLPAPLDAVA